jgi:hypothetical protein
MSYSLTFDSGKSWAAEQLDSIATRYLNRTAQIVAKHIRQTISHSQTPKPSTSMRPPPIVTSQDEFVVPNVETWSSSSEELPYQAYITQGNAEASTSEAAAMSVSGLGG